MTPAIAGWSVAGFLLGALHTRALWMQARFGTRPTGVVVRWLAITSLLVFAVRDRAWAPPIAWGVGFAGSAARYALRRERA